LGQTVTLKITTDPQAGHIRYINGMVRRIARAEQGHEFHRFRLELVPTLWLLTRNMDSRIFQQMTVPDILKKVLTGLPVTYELQGQYKSREYCVQYRESDFNFASRLMEEEGIYYFFKHSAGSHQMVVADTPQSHPAVPYGAKATYDGGFAGTPEDDRITDWSIGQEIRAGKSTLWDEHFQLPYKHLEADKKIQESVSAGKVNYKLNAGGASNIEAYEFPGEYSRHFDGITKTGGEQPDHLQWIFEENKRTASVRIQQQAAETMSVDATSGHAGMTAGHTFDLSEHFSDDSKYVVTAVEHHLTQGIGTDARSHVWDCWNNFTCMPIGIPYRPQRVTSIPSVRGVQLATVVGPSDEEIFTDKYGRIKVQFHWDRQGKNDADSSCWLRVGTYWAGKQWGAIHIPRIGQEVVVAFEEGDVDHPIVVGSVYNADQMPPYKLPDKKTVSTTKSHSTKKGQVTNYNELRFEDLKGKEQVYFHAERDMDELVNNDSRESVMHDRDLAVNYDQREKVLQNKHGKVCGNRIVETMGNVTAGIGGNRDWTVKGNSRELVQGNNHITVNGDDSEKVGGNMSITIGQSLQEKTGTKFAHEAGQEIHLKAGMKVIIEGGMQVTLKGPGGFVDIGPSGVTIQGTMVLINSGGAAGSGSGSSPTAPESPQYPQPDKPNWADPGPNFTAGKKVDEDAPKDSE
jgi:type VI secretion system secreted protein VgrG